MSAITRDYGDLLHPSNPCHQWYGFPNVDKCNDATEMAIEAAHNVEVGDYYFQAKNYNSALLRYQDADEKKPGDAAIHVRLGRVFERLGRLPQAIEQYKAAQALAGPEKWLDEAKAALLRLEPPRRS